MKINSLRFLRDKKKVSKIFLIPKLTICLFLIGTIQLFALSSPLTGGPNLKAGTPIPAEQQGIRVSGVVTDATSREAIIGATVKVEGTVTGASTDVNGRYTVIVPTAASVLTFSFIGYQTKQVTVNNQTIIDVSLVMAEQALEEVVVVGYGVQKKATVTGAIATVSQAQLLQTPVANISNALVGRLPGLLSVQRSGLPGADQSQIRIRGVSTFMGSSDPLIIVDGIQSDDYNNIDPNEIESISILKDASATAVYGVRGANGVLLITTRRGKIGKPQFSYTGQVAFAKFTAMPHSMNSYDYAVGRNNARKYDSYVTGAYTLAYPDYAIERYKKNDDPIFYPNIDWWPYMFDRTNTETNHNMNISGGTEKVKYFISLGYFTQDGLFNHTKLMTDYDAQPRYKRYNIRSNFDFNITKRLTASMNLGITIGNTLGTARELDLLFSNTSSCNPMATPGIVDGKFVSLDAAGVTGIGGAGPLTFLQATGYQKYYSNTLQSSIRFNYDLDFITKGLSVHSTVSYNNFNDQTLMYRNYNLTTYLISRALDQSLVFTPQSDPAPYGFTESFGKNRKVYSEYGLDYTRKFGGHSFSGKILYNQEKYYSPDQSENHNQFLVPRGYQGLVGRAQYDYQSRYLAEFDLGYNGNENFAPGKRFGFFPAYSIGWVISQESFFPKNNVITYLKFRGSYGEVGNDKVGGNRFLYREAAYTYSGNFYRWGTYPTDKNGYQASLEGALGNPDVTWERAKKTDIGADINIFKDKIKVTFDYFTEKRDNILAPKNTVPMIVAAALPRYNMGKMRNSGWDGDVTVINTFGKFNLWLKFNFTYARNIIEFQDEITRPFTYQNRTGQTNGQMFGLISDGFYNTWEAVNDAMRPVSIWTNNKLQPGDIKYYDVNGDGKTDNDDAVPIGYPTFPENIYGISLGGDFRGFDFSVLFQGASHVSVSYYSQQLLNPFVNGWGAQDYLNESWSWDRYLNGLPINFPRFTETYTSSQNYQNSSWRIVDASYLRMKNTEIGYTIPEKLVKRTGLNFARVYVNANNLFTWSKLLPGIDPESASEYATNKGPYPVTRTINFGINIKF